MKDKRDWGLHLPMQCTNVRGMEANQENSEKTLENMNLKDSEHDVEITFDCTHLRYI